MKEAWKKQWKRLYNPPSTSISKQCKRVFSALSTPPEVLIDIGVGLYNSEAWFFSEEYPDCKIVGFEPQPDRFRLLLDHNYPGILLPYVISNVNGVVKGHMGYPEGRSEFLLFAEGKYLQGYKKVSVTSHTLDSLEKTLGPFNNAFIWADIEGSELAAFRGATRLFNENKIIGVNFEARINRAYSSKACCADELVTFFKEKRFRKVGKGKHRKCDMIFLRN